MRLLTIAPPISLAISLVLGMLSACKGDGRPANDSAASEPAQPGKPAPLPKSEAEFLAELAPLPDGAAAIEVHYQITGSGLTGGMTTLLAAGGDRRESWQLSTGTDAAKLSATGLRIVTAQHLYISNDGGPGELATNHLGALAAAYMELPEDARRGVVESIRAWHRMLAEQRERDDSARAEVLGVTCLQTRIAAQNVCLWEETGLLLRYEGSAFRIEATKIDRAPHLTSSTFALPLQSQLAEEIATAEQDYAQILQDIAAGSYGSVSALLLAGEALPELRAPTPTELAPNTPVP